MYCTLQAPTVVVMPMLRLAYLWLADRCDVDKCPVERADAQKWIKCPMAAGLAAHCTWLTGTSPHSPQPMACDLWPISSGLWPKANTHDQ